jgi:hypothetical protein
MIMYPLSRPRVRRYQHLGKPSRPLASEAASDIPRQRWDGLLPLGNLIIDVELTLIWFKNLVFTDCSLIKPRPFWLPMPKLFARIADMVESGGSYVPNHSGVNGFR